MRNFANLAWSLAAGTVLLTACAYSGAEQSRDFNSVLPAAGITQLTVDGSNGDVYVTAANVNRIRVQARLTTHDIQGLGNDAVTVTKHGSQAVVASVCAERSVLFFTAQNCDVEYWITYPRALHASISSVNGDVDVHGPAASVDARTTNGDVTIDGATGSVAGRSTNGNVDVESARGDIAAMSSEGNVSASLSDNWSGRSIALRTHFGDVNLRVPQNFRATLHLRTLAGDVTGARDIPSGSVVVEAQTVFGDIDFARE